jgi:flagellar motor protein MotB
MEAGGEEADGVNYWPALLDLVTSSLMLFLLLTFLQASFSAESLESVTAHTRQEQFLQLFRPEFAAEIAAGAVTVERTVDLIQITFSDKVLFASGDYRLQPAGSAILARCAHVFGRAGGATFEQIQVEGHTDQQPLQRREYPADNWELSTARALSVVQFLAAGRGLAPELFSANGYGSYRPVAANQTAEGRARNRRIEIRLFFVGTGHSAAIPRRTAPRPASP